MSLARNTLVQTGFTLLSRLLGYARDRAISNMMGAGPIGDAFATAQMFPNLFRRLLAEGAVSQAFVPLYAEALKTSGQDSAERTAGQCLSVLTLASACVVIACQIAMPWIMLVLHRGYADRPDDFALAVLLTQITMPYLAGMTMSALFSGMLNTAGRFALSAAAPTLLNLAILAAVLPAGSPQQAAQNGAIAICAAGALQAGLLYWGCRRLGVRIRLRKPALTPEVRRMLALMAPAALAGSATQINVFVSQALASFETGAKSWLYAADRLYQLPLGLIGVAVGVALLPRLSLAAARGDASDAHKAMDEAFSLSMAFTLPAAAALMVMPFFLMHGFWTGGQFTEADARATADALFHYGWGVPAFVLIRVLAPPFFARQDTRRPMRFALAGVAANLAVGAGLFFALRAAGMPGYVGLAAGTSAAAWFNALLLARALLADGGWRPGPSVAGRLLRILAATACMAAFLGLAAAWRVPIEAALEAQVVIGKEIAVLLACLCGAGIYAAAALALGATSLSEIRAAMRRPRDAGPLPPANAD